MQVYAQESLPQLLIITGLIGGGAAALAGRAIALTWRPFWQVVPAMLLLGAAVRFVHFALGTGMLLSLPAYLADSAVLLAIGSLAWRIVRARQMVTQYPWLYERAGLLHWRERPQQPVDNGSFVR